MRRREPLVDQASALPPELRRRPATAEEIDYWLAGDEMPADWDLGGPVWWRLIVSYQRWSRAHHQWRANNDPTYPWYGKP